MVIFFIFLAAFANAIYILNLERIKTDWKNLLIDSYTDSNTLTNALLMQYLLALGDFNFTEYFVATSTNSNLVWIIFIMATFLIQITILNMLIAIMGDAFDRVTEVKE